jgi:vitamin B12 transporter
MKVIVSLSLLICFVARLFSMCAAEEVAPKSVQTLEPQSPKESEGKTGEAIPQTKLEEMVVTATAIPTSTKELPVSVVVISRKEIEESHSNDLAQLLIEKLPEHFQNYPGALTSVTIRGQRSNTVGTDVKGHVLVLIDGHRSGTGNIAVIPLDNVERLEVVRGPGSAIYGAAAMGGVVNVITRKGAGTPSGSVAVESGSWDYLKGSAQASGGLLDDKLGFSLTGRGLFQNSDYKTGAGQIYPNTQYNDEAYSLSLRATPDPNHQFFAVANYFRGWDIGNPGPTYSPDPDDFTNILRRYCSLAYDGSQPDYGLNWHLSYFNVLDQSSFNDPSAAWGYSSTTTDTTTQGVRGNFSFPTLSIGRLLMGLEWDGIKQDTSTTPLGYNWSPNAQYNNYAFLAEESVNWDKLSFLAGLRYDLWQENIEPTQGLKVTSQSENFGHVSWRTGAKYWLLDWLAGRAAVGTGFRAPSADELAGRYTHGSFTKIIGNPALQPETSMTYEFGLDAEYAGFTGGLGWFHTNECDRIAAGFPACVEGDCTWTRFKNVEAAVLSAIEANVSYKQPFSFLGLSITLRPFANLSYYTQRELQDTRHAKTLNSDIVPYVALWNVTGGVELNVNQIVSLTFSGVFDGPLEEEDWNWLSPTYTQAVGRGGFAVFSVRLSVTPVKYFNCFLGVENLTNLDYAFVNGYPMPGRIVRGGLEMRF